MCVRSYVFDDGTHKRVQNYFPQTYAFYMFKCFLRLKLYLLYISKHTQTHPENEGKIYSWDEIVLPFWIFDFILGIHRKKDMQTSAFSPKNTQFDCIIVEFALYSMYVQEKSVQTIYDIHHITSHYDVWCSYTHTHTHTWQKI